MELAKIAELPQSWLYVPKIVGDNLDEADCDKYNDAEARRGYGDCWKEKS